MGVLEPQGNREQPETTDNTVALVKLVTEIGPDIAEISRRLGQFKESVRYRYKEKIIKRGFGVKADLDYGTLGLTRVVMRLKFADSYKKRAREIFEAMNELSYIVAYAGTMPNDVYVVHGGVPTQFTTEFRHLVQGLRAKGIFSSVEFFECDWFRVAPMRAECFNFDEGVWDFDWSRPPQIDERAARATISEKKKLDKIDLLLVKELMKDSNRSLKEIHEAIKKINSVDVNYKTLGWHYKNHVLQNHLIRDYSISWHGLQSNFSLERVQHLGNHEYLGLSLIVRETNPQERVMLRSKLNRLPFQWSEAAGDAYYSQFFFPLGTVNEALEYLKALLSPYGERAEIFLIDKRELRTFTIAFNLWDEERGWTFDPAKLLTRLEGTVLSTRERYA